MQELSDERQAIKSALNELLVDTFVFETDAGAQPYTIQDTYLAALESSDLYIGVFWKDYGPYTVEDTNTRKPSEWIASFREARYVQTSRDPRLQSFLDTLGGEVVRGHTVKWFTESNDLQALVKTDVAAWQARCIQMEGKAHPPSIFVGVPSLPATFVGRRELLLHLTKQLRSERHSLIALEGLPGVGKTTLAVALVQQRGVLRHFTDGVLWASLGKAPNVMALLAIWAEALGVDVSKISDPGKRSRTVKDAIGLRRMLLVIDDAWTIEAANLMRCTDQVGAAGGPHCSCILTTRNKELARALAGQPNVETVPLLESKDAYTLMETLAPEACAANPQAVRKLIEAVDGLPLALTLLAGTFRDPLVQSSKSSPTSRKRH